MVQVSGGAPGAQNAASPRQSRANLRIGDNRVDTIFERGQGPALFLPAWAEAPMKASPNPIEQSFELAASRCADLTPQVYQRLFEQHPETQTMFRSQGRELVMGSMLALAIEAVLDFADERRGHFRLIACEAASHDAYGTSRELFIAFFAIVRDTLRDLLGDEWSPGIALAWDALLVEIDAFADEPA